MGGEAWGELEDDESHRGWLHPLHRSGLCKKEKIPLAIKLIEEGGQEAEP